MSKYARYIEAWKKNEREQFVENENRRKKALQCSKLLVDILVKQFDVKKVIIFGSLLREGNFNDRSDIDIAVEGLRKHMYFAALAKLMDVSEWKVDLKPIEDMDGLILYKISQGKVVYEKEKNT